MKISPSKFNSLTFNTLTLIAGCCLSTTVWAGGYIDLSLGITTDSLESETSSSTNENTTLAPDIDATVGYSFKGAFIGAKYFTHKQSKTANQDFNTYTITADQVGTTSGVGITAGLVKNGLSLLYTHINGASQNATVKTRRNSSFDSSLNANAESTVELSDGSGYQVDFFYGIRINKAVYFGPKLSYSTIKYEKYSVNQEISEEFIALSQTKFTPKVGLVASF